MKEIIQALKNQEIDAATILQKMELGDANASIHIFGRDGNYFCEPELISTWLSLLVLLASSENVTGQSIAHAFTKSCGGCMVYTILMVVACFRGKEIARLAFDFFRHILADPNGDILELNEIDQIASLLNQHIPRRQDGTMMRFVCLEVRHIAHYADPTTNKGQIAVKLRDLIESLGALCTSRSFASEMKANSTSTIEIIKESMKNKTFSRKFVEEKWP
ncbi:unnamed protein product [Didymodactylos carnosus]|uniref:Uncharacterized protein n=1 Tax=Didymodactylos carnosus TaxID=1234261 RepID=A0A8S2QPM4_9BILA|nr:unnamed protein product [Didymodactylos carnosus]CAF4123927.1 unnamed protein product [Didymodactylos carnosus]